MNFNYIYIFSILIVFIILMLPVFRRRVSDPEENINPVSEAEVYLSYGHYKKAIDLLESYLQENPGNSKAMKILMDAKKGVEK